MIKCIIWYYTNSQGPFILTEIIYSNTEIET